MHTLCWQVTVSGRGRSAEVNQPANVCQVPTAGSRTQGLKETFTCFMQLLALKLNLSVSYSLESTSGRPSGPRAASRRGESQSLSILPLHPRGSIHTIQWARQAQLWLHYKFGSWDIFDYISTFTFVELFTLKKGLSCFLSRDTHSKPVN